MSDAISLLMVHGKEMDSNGKLINRILNYSSISVLIFQGCMISLFLVKEKYSACVSCVVIFIVSAFYAWRTSSDFIFDFYSLHERLSKYEQIEGAISLNEVNKWRNMFKHPLVLPIFIESSAPQQGSPAETIGTQNHGSADNFIS